MTEGQKKFPVQTNLTLSVTEAWLDHRIVFSGKTQNSTTQTSTFTVTVVYWFQQIKQPGKPERSSIIPFRGNDTVAAYFIIDMNS